MSSPGASSGLGEAASKYFAQLGATVVLGARRAERIKHLAMEINSNGGKALAVTVDVTKREEVKGLVDSAVKEFGRVDVILNNAGIMPLSPMDRLNVDEWNKMIDVNIKGVLNGVAAVLPYMKEQNQVRSSILLLSQGIKYSLVRLFIQQLNLPFVP